MGMTKREMAAFYLEKDATIELLEEPRKLTKAERDHQHKINVADKHKLKYYNQEYKETKREIDDAIDKV